MPIDGLDDAGNGFLAPKKLGGGAARETGRALLVDLGLGEAVGTPGVKEVEAGLGRNSVTLGLNFVEVADDGVGAPLKLCGPPRSVLIAAGPVGGARLS